MSTLRRKYRVSWDDGEPVEITTSARDMANAQEWADPNDMGTSVFALIHSALEREGHSPPDLDKFIDVLDDLEDLSGGPAIEASPT